VAVLDEVKVAVKVTVVDLVGVIVAVVELLGVTLVVAELVGVIVALSDCVAVWDAVIDAVGDRVDDSETVDVIDFEGVADGVEEGAGTHTAAAMVPVHPLVAPL